MSTTNAPYTVSLAPPAKVVFTAAPTLSPPSFSGQANSSPTLGKFTVQEQDAWGNPASNGSVTVGLVSTSSGGVFSLTSGGPAVTSIQIPAGSNSASFYYGDTAAGSPTITASTTAWRRRSPTERSPPVQKRLWPSRPSRQVQSPSIRPSLSA